MGKTFGELARIRGMIYYRISPHEQKAFVGMISDSLPNLWVRFTDNVFRVAPTFIISYLIYDQGTKRYHQLQRKNPKDFENDV